MRALFFTMATVFFVAPLWAKPAKTGAKADVGTTLTGKVEVATNKTSKVTAVSLVADDGTVYAVVLNREGRALGATLANKRAEIVGKVTDKIEKDVTAKLLKVATYKEVSDDVSKRGDFERPKSKPATADTLDTDLDL